MSHLRRSDLVAVAIAFLHDRAATRVDIVPVDAEARHGSHIIFFAPEEEYIEEEQGRAMRTIASFREAQELPPGR